MGGGEGVLRLATNVLAHAACVATQGVYNIESHRCPTKKVSHGTYTPLCRGREEAVFGGMLHIAPSG